jgi:hypothetical protein
MMLLVLPDLLSFFNEQLDLKRVTIFLSPTATASSPAIITASTAM